MSSQRSNSQYMTDMAGYFFTGVVVGGFMMLFVYAMVDGLITEPKTRLRFEKDAIKNGAAVWHVDENGNRVFQWKQSK